MMIDRMMRVARSVPVGPRAAPLVRSPAAPRRPATPPGSADGVDQNQMQQAELQLAMQAQAARFDAMMKVLAEQQREINAIIDLGMAQTKRDDALMNQWIRLI